MFCPDCFSDVRLVVDGKMMSEDELLHLPKAPKTIERRLTHKRWCPSNASLITLDSITFNSNYTKSYWSKGQ